MTPAELKHLRTEAGLTQAEMAARLGLSPRAYQDLEAGEALRGIHQLAAAHVSLELALEKRNPMLATESARTLAMGMFQLLFPNALTSDPGPTNLPSGR